MFHNFLQKIMAIVQHKYISVLLVLGFSGSSQIILLVVGEGGGLKGYG